MSSRKPEEKNSIQRKDDAVTWANGSIPSAEDPSTGAGALLAQGTDPGGNWLAVIQAVKGIFALVAPVAVICVFLSFSPPARYKRWLHSQQPESSSS